VKLFNRIEEFQDRLDRPIFDDVEPTSDERIRFLHIVFSMDRSYFVKHPSTLLVRNQGIVGAACLTLVMFSWVVF
jgi:hypothetical protein